MKVNLRDLNVAGIDMDEARRHFDLPIDNMSRREMLRVLEGTLREIMAMIGDDTTLRIWRGIVVEPGWIDDLSAGASLGRSWSFDRDVAMRFAEAGPEDVGIILQAEVDLDAIDWSTTVAVNAFTVEECEICLEEEAALQDVQLSITGPNTHMMSMPGPFMA